MRNQRLRVFVSSRMEELQRERQAIRAALAEMLVEAFVFEADAGARPQSIQQTYLEEVEDADLYVGVFWKGYGAHTIAEFERASSLGMDCLIYEKRADLGEGRDPSLQEFLDRIGQADALGGVTIGRFQDPEELTHAIKEDVSRWRDRLVREAQESARAIFHGVPSRPPSDFVGRGPELAHLMSALRASQDVAIEGLPGVGKTTLALALVYQPAIRRHFRDGVLWASLGPKADPANAIATWAQGLRRIGAVAEHIARLPDVADRTQALRDAISDRRMLLVIDDAWEIDAGQALRCGGARCSHVITTRDKQVAHAFAGSASAQPLHAFDEADAWQLLQLLAPEACSAEADRVRGLIHAVGALPQAVRLIGGYLGGSGASMFGEVFGELSTKALEEMADPTKRLRLAETRLGNPTGGKKTLEDTISLSLDGLPEAAQNAFYSLGAFAAKPDRFTPAAAAAVTNADSNALAALAGRNLLEVDKASRRLSVHPTIADVARARMPAEAIARHRSHHLEALKDNGGDPARVEELYPQIRWAWQQAPDDDVLLVMLGALEPFQRYRGLSAETLAWSRRALRVAEARSMTPATARVTELMGDAERELGRFELALDHFRQALLIGESMADAWWRIDMHAKIALALGKLARPEEALTEAAKARALADGAGDRSRQAETLLVTASLLRDCDRLESALTIAREALAILRETGDKVWEADCLGLLSNIHRDLDDHESALEYARMLTVLQAESGNPASDAEARLLMARMSGARGQMEDALATARDACAKAEISGSRSVFSIGLHVVADLLLQLGHLDEALRYRQRQLTLHDEVGNRAGRADVLQSIARILYNQERYREAQTAHLEALRIYEELDDRVRQATALELLRFTHRPLEERSKEIACLNEALRLWREVGDRGAQARVLSELGRLYMSLDQPGQALDAYAQADALFSQAGDAVRQAAALESMAGAEERLALEREFPATDTTRPHADDRRLEHLDRAIASLSEAARLEPGNTIFAEKRDRLIARRRLVSRFGPRLLSHRPIVPRLVLAVGARLTRWLGGDALRPTLLPVIEGVREAIELSMGALPPRLVLTENRLDVAGDAFQIFVDGVPLSPVVMNEDERLFAGPPEKLRGWGVAGRAATHPYTGEPAAWLARKDWRIVEEAGHPAWTPAEYIAWHLRAVMQKHLWKLVGHQQTFDMVDRSVPEVATQLRRDPDALTALVLILQNLLEEQVPLLPYRPIAETFIALHAKGTGRLRILASVRLLPDVRARLPGNLETGCCIRLPASLEEEIEGAIRTIDGMEYLVMEPDSIERALALVGREVSSHSNLAAILVENAGVRRFVRKLVELRFPRLFVISREELLPDRAVRIVDAREVGA